MAYGARIPPLAVRSHHPTEAGKRLCYTPPVSKIRQQFTAPPDAPLDVEPTGDLKPYVVFTQLREKGPFIYAGWLEAADDAMAMAFAIEHYGQDQECVNVMAIDRANLTSSDGLYRAAIAGYGVFHIFTQKKPGDLWLAAGTVDAESPQAALEAARATNKLAANAHVVWVAHESKILSTHNQLVWRHTDQSYRLARGYGREVRAKWIAFRDEKQLAEYEKDDLADAF